MAELLEIILSQSSIAVAEQFSLLRGQRGSQLVKERGWERKRSGIWAWQSRSSNQWSPTRGLNSQLEDSSPACKDLTYFPQLLPENKFLVPQPQRCIVQTQPSRVTSFSSSVTSTRDTTSIYTLLWRSSVLLFQKGKVCWWSESIVVQVCA